MRPDRFATAVLFFSVCFTVTARCQGLPPGPGTRVRVTIPCSAVDAVRSGRGMARCRHEGSVARMPGDSITVDLNDSTISYAWKDISRLEVGRGHRTYWLTGAGIGFVVGAGVTWLVTNAGGSTSLCDRSANQDALSTTECLGLAVLGGVAGGGVGAIIGHAIRSERWQDFPLGPVQVGLASAQGIRVGWNLAF